MDDETDADYNNKEPAAKKPKTDFCSDNSASLPGILSGGDVTGPVGFEPGMFKQEDVSPGVPPSSGSKKSDATQKVCELFSIYLLLIIIVTFVLAEKEEKRQEKAQA